MTTRTPQFPVAALLAAMGGALLLTACGGGGSDDNGVLYLNCGDWVDSCTAIVEHLDGRLELIDWGGKEHRENLAEEVACAL